MRALRDREFVGRYIFRLNRLSASLLPTMLLDVPRDDETFWRNHSRRNRDILGDLCYVVTWRNRLTIATHPDSDALLEAAILAAVPVDTQDAALLILSAGPVLDLLLNAASEETLRITNETFVSLTVTVRGGLRRAIGPRTRGGQITFAQAPH